MDLIFEWWLSSVLSLDKRLDNFEIFFFTVLEALRIMNYEALVLGREDLVFNITLPRRAVRALCQSDRE